MNMKHFLELIKKRKRKNEIITIQVPRIIRIEIKVGDDVRMAR